MVTGISNTSGTTSVTSAETSSVMVKVVPQSPGAVRDGKVTVRFEANDFGGARPEALKLDGKVYAIEPFILSIGPSAGQLYYDVKVPAFARDGDHMVQVRVKGTWRPVALRVLIPLHQ